MSRAASKQEALLSKTSECYKRAVDQYDFTSARLSAVSFSVARFRALTPIGSLLSLLTLISLGHDSTTGLEIQALAGHLDAKGCRCLEARAFVQEAHVHLRNDGLALEPFVPRSLGRTTLDNANPCRVGCVIFGLLWPNECILGVGIDLLGEKDCPEGRNSNLEEAEDVGYDDEQDVQLQHVEVVSTRR